MMDAHYHQGQAPPAMPASHGISGRCPLPHPPTAAFPQQFQFPPGLDNMPPNVGSFGHPAVPPGHPPSPPRALYDTSQGPPRQAYSHHASQFYGYPTQGQYAYPQQGVQPEFGAARNVVFGNPPYGAPTLPSSAL